MNQEELYKHTDITKFLRVGLGRDITEQVTVIEKKDATYPIKPYIWDNWFPFAYIAFQRLNDKLKEEGKTVESFATIGTGNGADAIGALYAFQDLVRIVLTDINEKVFPVSVINVDACAWEMGGVANGFALRNPKITIGDRDLYINTLVGLLCEPLKRKNLQVDVIYENLPNIPDSGNIIEGYKKASRYQKGSLIDQDKIADFSDKLKETHKKILDYLLESHFASLIEAKDSLNPGGSLICAIGGRVPYELFKEMVETAGYQFQELVAGFKKQTEPWEVIPGYADAEKGNIEFDFYRYDEAVQYLKNKGLIQPFVEGSGRYGLIGDLLKESIKPYRISAREALKMYKKDPNVNLGHIVYMIRAIKEREISK